METTPSSATYSTSGLARSNSSVFSENLPVMPKLMSTESNDTRVIAHTGEAVQEVLLPLLVRDRVRTNVARKPFEVFVFRDAVLEFDDVGTLLDFSLVFLNPCESRRRGTENRGCQQGKGCSDESEETHTGGDQLREKVNHEDGLESNHPRSLS